MSSAVVHGFLFGGLLSLMVGPVFFALVQDSMEKGFKAGFFMALGIVAGDALYIFLTQWAYEYLEGSPGVKQFLAFGGAAVLIGFGVYSFLKAPLVASKNIQLPGARTLSKQMMKGFLLNAVNPFVLFFWMGMVTYVNLDKGYVGAEKMAFFLMMLLTILLTDAFKVFGARRLRLLFTPKRMQWMNRIVGSILVVFGIRMILFAITSA